MNLRDLNSVTLIVYKPSVSYFPRTSLFTDGRFIVIPFEY